MKKTKKSKMTALVPLPKALVPQPSLKEILGKFSAEEILRNLPQEEILKSLQIYIPPAAPVGPDRVWKPNFFLGAAEVFTKKNLPPEHTRLGLIFLVALTSAHVGHPVVLEVIDDVSVGAADVLQRSKELVGISFWKAFQQMSRNDLIAAKADLKGKCIVEGDGTKFEKGKNVLNQFLADQRYDDQDTINSRFGPVSIPAGVKGPTACLLVSSNQNKLILTHPSFLGVHFKPTIQSSYAPELEERGIAQLEVKSDLIKSYLHRLQKVPVKIPYCDVIVQHLQSSKNQYVIKKIEMLLRMLKAVTIINYSSAMTTGEYYNRLHGSDPRTVEVALGIPAIPQEGLIARKADYVTFWILVDGMVKIEDVSFSPVERRVFNVVMNFNRGVLNFLPENTTKFERIAQIPRDPNSWPDLEEIFERINKDGGGEIGSTSTLYKILHDLEKKGVMKDEEHPNGRKHGYYVTTFDLADTISLPHPSEIEDPFTGKDPIKFINPITGEIQEM